MSPIILFIGKTMATEYSKEELVAIISELRTALTEIYMYQPGHQAGIATNALQKTDQVLLLQNLYKHQYSCLEALIKLSKKDQNKLLTKIEKILK